MDIYFVPNKNIVLNTVENWRYVKDMVPGLQMLTFYWGEKTKQVKYDPCCTVWGNRDASPSGPGSRLSSKTLPRGRRPGLESLSGTCFSFCKTSWCSATERLLTAPDLQASKGGKEGSGPAVGAVQGGPCEHDSCGEVAAENAGCVPRRVA